MPTCRMEIGNSGWGLLLSHSLKSGCGSSTWSCSTSLSSWGIQLSDKWQLAKNTQLPYRNGIKRKINFLHKRQFTFFKNPVKTGNYYLMIWRGSQPTSLTPSLIIRVAIGAWPWPKERAWKRFDIPEFSASCNKALVGSWVKNVTVYLVTTNM